MELQISRGVHPKRRKQKSYGALRRHLGDMFHELVSRKDPKIVERYLMGDHVRICYAFRRSTRFQP